jgi:hypothetical protein
MTDEIADAGAPRERVLAVAAQIAHEGTGPVTGIALAARAGVDPMVVSRHR